MSEFVYGPDEIDATVACGCEPLHYCQWPDGHEPGAPFACTECGCEWRSAKGGFS